MPVASKVRRNWSQLRSEAAFRLKIGVLPSKEWNMGVDTLGLLFKLASSPETVMEGLKLLHELQTLQIELEMQHQELERNFHQHDKQFGIYKALFDQAPFGYLVVQVDGVIIKANEAALNLMGLPESSCLGKPFESFFTLLSAYGFQDLLKQTDGDLSSTMCVLELKPAKGRPKRLQLLISCSPDRDHFLLGLSSYDQLLKT